MKCPKCQYISFDSGERCRNCGYEFSLSADAASAAASSPDLPIKNDRDTDGPLGDFSLNTPNLPLFKPETEPSDAPLVAVRATPRAPLAVRRPAPVAPRPKPKKESAPAEPLLDLEASDPLAGSGFVSERDAPPTRDEHLVTSDDAPVAASALARIAGGAIDFALIGGMDVLVIYFTLRICDLTFGEVSTLPMAPLLSFFLLLNGGYLSAFVAAGGQTIGKMAAGTRVIPAAPETKLHGRVSFGQAVVRAAGYLVSALPAGLGFVPALAGERRALHDRLADTRVVKA